MKRVKSYLRLFRVKHYIKNLLIFVPIFFGGGIFNPDIIKTAATGFVLFCILSSVIYIINDYKDYEQDREHPTKRKRPIASGEISKKEAFIALVVLMIAGISITIITNCYSGSICLLVYFLINILYSTGLKNIPIIDIVILSAGYVIRVLYGGIITGIDISIWLFLVVLTGSLYMGLGKRRNGMKSESDKRRVYESYNVEFLDKNMYLMMTLTDVFYSLWTVEHTNAYIKWTIPIFLVLMMLYAYDIDGDSDGDPVEVMTHNIWFLITTIIYAIVLYVCLYN